MTSSQLLSFSVIVLMMAAFIWGRFRYDVVAMAALLAALAVGVVPLSAAFSGFSDDIVIIVGSALIVSHGVARSGVMEYAVQHYARNVSSVRAQLALLVIVVTLLSAFVKNIGALAIMIPIAFQFARRSNTSPSVFLMPMAFGSLLGGLLTQVGTSPNIVVSRVRGEMTGTPFSMFDFTPVAAALCVAGVIFLILFYRLVPIRSRDGAPIHEAIDIKNYLAEANISATSAVRGKPISTLLKIAEGEVAVTSIMRGGLHLAPLPDTILREGDVVLLEGDPEALNRVVSHGRLDLAGSRDFAGNSNGETETVEAVITENSPLIGWSAKQLALYERFTVNLLAVSRRNERLTGRLGELRLRLGDVIVLRGARAAMPEVLREFGCLPLAERSLRLGSVRRGIVPLVILAVAVGATAIGLLPVPIAFFAAAAAMVVFNVIPTREAYTALDGPILVMLAALIPVSDSLRTTGATDLIAASLADLGGGLPAYGAVALILVCAMAVTPFLNNAATVLVMAPIAAGFASGLGYRPEAFLMATAIGAGCDFLTPIGHQCNTLVMGPGGYRFSDYPRLGLPLSILVIIVAVPMLLIVWPLR